MNLLFGSEVWRWPVGHQLVLWLAMALLLAGVWRYLVRGRGLSTARRIILLTLRLGASALLLVMLMGPGRWVQTHKPMQFPEIIVLADASASMDQKDVAAHPGLSRWESLQATWLSPETMGKVGQYARVQGYQFDRGIRPMEGQAADAASRMGTDLFGALDKAIAGMDRQAAGDGLQRGGLALMLSDGHDTRRASDAALLARLRQQSWAVHVVPVGADHRQPDVTLLAWAQSDYVLQGQSTVLHATVSQSGYAGRSTQVDLLLEGELVESRTIHFDRHASGRGEVSLQFNIIPQGTGSGPLSVLGYQIVVRPLQGEQYTDNNSRWIFLQVSQQHMNVALFEAQPYWDTRFLAQVLRNDPQVNLVTVFGMGPGRQVVASHQSAGDGAMALTFPLAASQLAKFDIIILGRGCEQFFPGGQAQLLVDFVREQGGSLIFARGRAFDITTQTGLQAQGVIEPIEPVQWGRQMVDDLTLSLAPAGRRSPLLEFNLPQDTDAILTNLPGMIAATRVAREKAASVVLLTQSPRKAAAGTEQGASAMAAMAHQNAGAGQVMAVLSDGMWQWAFLPASLKGYDSIYQQFWARAIRWLAAGGEFLPGQSISLSLSSLSAEPHEPVIITAAMRYAQGNAPTPVVNVIAPDGSRHPVAMGRHTQQLNRWAGQFTPALSGVHVVELVNTGMDPPRLTARLAVYDQTTEVMDPSARPQTLRALAAATGGQVYELDRPDSFLEHLRQIQLSQEADRQIEDRFDRPWLLMLVMALLGMEWLIRRRHGLA